MTWTFSKKSSYIKDTKTNRLVGKVANYDASEEKVKDGKLMAASPELLEACKEALEWVDFTGRKDIEKRIKQAINKAEGAGLRY